MGHIPMLHFDFFHTSLFVLAFFLSGVIFFSCCECFASICLFVFLGVWLILLSSVVTVQSRRCFSGLKEGQLPRG